MAQKSKPQIWAEYLATRAVLGPLSLLPRRVAMSLGVLAGGMGYHLLPKLRRVGLRNLAFAFPGKPVSEHEAILKGAFRNIGRVMGVVSQFARLTPANLGELIDHDPDPAFAAAYEKTKTDGRGRIILGGHMGNWELQAFAYPVLFEPLNFLARKMDNPLIEKMILGVRTRLGNVQLDKTNAAGPMLRILRSGGNVGILADVNSHPKEGVFVPFFGIEACTAAGVAMLAMRANAVIVPMFAIWDAGRQKYFIWHDDIIEPLNTGDRKADIEGTTALYTAAVERVIRAYPDQWIWIHRRWKTRPPGEKELYGNGNGN